MNQMSCYGLFHLLSSVQVKKFAPFVLKSLFCADIPLQKLISEYVWDGMSIWIVFHIEQYASSEQNDCCWADYCFDFDEILYPTTNTREQCITSFIENCVNCNGDGYYVIGNGNKSQVRLCDHGGYTCECDIITKFIQISRK